MSLVTERVQSLYVVMETTTFSVWYLENYQDFFKPLNHRFMHFPFINSPIIIPTIFCNIKLVK